MVADDLECPRCKTTKYRNPQLKLLVNVCGHALCDKCVELLFVKGIAQCYECQTRLRRANFRTQLFQDGTVEREVQIRRDVARKLTRSETSFATLREYNDYLEQVETIIYNLANEIDVEANQKQLEQLISASAAAPRHASTLSHSGIDVVGEPYYYQPAEWLNDLEGPVCPHIEDLKLKHLRFVRPSTDAEKAAGFVPTIPALRALQEAFCGLYVHRESIKRKPIIADTDSSD